MKFLKFPLTLSLIILCLSLLSAQNTRKDSVVISDIPIEKMSEEERSKYLFDAIEEQDQQQTQRLVWSMAYYDHDENGETALTKAITQQNVEIVRFLSQKAVINLKNKAGETPLTLAVKQNHREIIEMVAERAKAAYKNDLDEAPLWLAVENGDLQIIQLLLDKGARIDLHSRGATPVSRAVETSKLPVLALLLKNGANPSKADKDGILPLAKAVETDQVIIAKMLLKKSTQPRKDANWKSEIGEPLLHRAIARKQETMVRLLLEYGAETNAVNYFDNNSLHVAAEAGAANLVSLLLENGADPQAENMMGETPEDLARAKNRGTVLQVFSSARDSAPQTKGLNGLADSNN
jgi:ankyrin repeat protein